MKKKMLILASVLGAGAIAFAATGERVQLVEAADHVDGALVTMTGNETADLTDVYAFMWDDAGTQAVALILGVGPFAASTDTFPQNVHYVFNLDRGGTTSQVICQFESDDNTAIRCWVGDATTNEILVGDASSASAPLTQNGIKIFAGLRKDPFTFNAAGFNATVNFVNANAGGLTPDPVIAGCFDLSDDNPGDDQTILTLAGALLGCLSSACDQGIGNQGQGAAADAFAAADVLALTVSLPLTAIAGTGDALSVYASTHNR